MKTESAQDSFSGACRSLKGLHWAFVQYPLLQVVATRIREYVSHFDAPHFSVPPSFGQGYWTKLGRRRTVWSLDPLIVCRSNETNREPQNWYWLAVRWRTLVVAMKSTVFNKSWLLYSLEGTIDRYSYRYSHCRSVYTENSGTFIVCTQLFLLIT